LNAIADSDCCWPAPTVELPFALNVLFVRVKLVTPVPLMPLSPVFCIRT